MRYIRYELEDKNHQLGKAVSTPCGPNPIVARTDSYYSSAYSVVTILPTNDLPVVDLDVNTDTDQYQVDFIEEGGPVSLTAVGNITDLDNTTLQYMTIVLGGVRDGDSEVIGVNLTGTSIQVTSNTSGVLTLTGPDLLTNFVFVLNSLTYDNVKRPQPTNGTRNATIVVNDGLGDSAAVEVRISVDIFNNAPILDLNGNAAGRDYVVPFTEEGPAILLTSQGTIIDSDSNKLIRFEASLEGSPTSGETLIWDETLVPATQSISCDSGCATGANTTVHQVVLTSRGENISVWQSILRSFSYLNRDDEPTGTSRSVRFNVTDDKEGATEQVTTILIVFLNDPPEVDLDIDPLSSSSPGLGYVVPNNNPANRLVEESTSGVWFVNLITAHPTTTGLGEAVTVTTILTTQPPTTTPQSTTSILGEAGMIDPTTAPTGGSQGRKRRQLDPDDVVDIATTPAVVLTTSGSVLTTEGLTTAAPTTIATTAAPTTQQQVTTAQTTQQQASQQAVTLGITAAQISATVSPGQRGYFVRDSDHAALVELIVVVNSNAPQFEYIDILNGNASFVGTTFIDASRFSLLLNRTLSGNGSCEQYIVYISSDLQYARLERDVFWSLGITVFRFTLISDNSTAEYENLLGNLRYRNSQPEPCCANSSSDAFVLRYLDVFARDGVANSTIATSVVTINLENDNPPVFEQLQYNVSLQENATVGVTLLVVTATDADVFGDHSNITYSISPGTAFNITTVGGAGHIFLGRTLDRETSAETELTVTASDGTNSGTAVVTITILDQNDNDPKFDQPNGYAVQIFENDQGAEITRFNVTDMDDGQNGVVEIFIRDNSENIFTVAAIDNTTGQYSLRLVASASLDRETLAFYSIRLEAQDRGLAPRLASVRVNITVLDLNDNPPVFAKAVEEVPVLETRSVSTTLPIIDLDPTDRDIGTNQVLFFNITETDGEGVFTVNSSTGEVFQVASLDYEKRTHYTLKIRADNWPAGNYSTQYRQVSVLINVTDVNDNPPAFNETSYTRHIFENRARGEYLFSVFAEDSDSVEKTAITYSMVSSSGNGSTFFSINSTNGAVYAAGSLDREASVAYTFDVQATDNHPPRRFATVNVVVVLLDENDKDPVFPQSVFTVNFFEANLENASVTTQVRASDDDIGSNAAITYSISPDTDFSIDPISGEVFARNTLDFDPPVLEQAFTLTVTATDGGAIPRSSTTTLSVTVVDINDNPPNFNTTYSFSVLENRPISTVIDTVQAYDIDSGANSFLSYTLIGSGSGRFNVRQSGEVITSARLDREERDSYSFILMADDNGVPSLNGTTALQITVLDENDVTPRFLRTPYVFNISETTDRDTPIGEVEAQDTDTDMFSTITYSVIDASQTVEVDANGTLTLRQLVDYEAGVRTLQISVNASDGELHSVAPVTIHVMDANDNRPVLTNLPDNTTVAENDFTPFFTVTATDADVSQDFKTVTYSIYSPSAESPTSFGIDPTSGEVRIIRNIDAETWTYTSIAIQACNSGGTISCSDVFDHELGISVNRRPDLQDVYRFDLVENTGSGVFVGQLTATDLNCADAQRNCLFFELVDSTPYLTINSGTGEIFTSATPVDREQVQTITVTVRATDSGAGRLSDTGTLTVTIIDQNDVPPCFERRSYSLSVVENRNNELVGRLKINDTDAHNNSMVSAQLTGLGSENFYLQVTSSNGSAILYTSRELDRESIASYSLNVIAMDMGAQPLNCSSSLVISVIDENDNCPIFGSGPNSTLSYTTSVPEFQPVDTVAFTFDVRDLDVGANSQITLSVSPPQQSFRISGMELLVNRPLDPEGGSGLPRQYNLVVTATDGGQPPCSTNTTLTIDVSDANDNTPSRSDATASVVEEQTPPVSVFTATFTDPDFGPNGQLNYSFSPTSEGMAQFSIDTATGEITTKVVLDRETKGTYALVVQAVDQPLNATQRRTGTATITVTVTDINDNDPGFLSLPFVFSVSEDITTGDPVGTITGVDRDIGSNGLLTYTILQDPSSWFVINNATGAITSNVASLDRETRASVLLSISVSDNGSPSRVTNVSATVTLIDVNDNTPDVQFQTFVVDEDIPVGTFLSPALTANDLDIGVNAQVDFYLDSVTDRQGNVTGPFFTVHKNGTVAINNSLDYETHTTMDLVVYAIDRGTPPRRSSLRKCVVDIRNVNDNPPFFTRDKYNQTIIENAAAGTLIADLDAVDPDATGLTQIFQIVSVTGVGSSVIYFHSFDIDTRTGVVTVTTTNNLNYEDAPLVIITASVSDQTFASQTNITVTLTDFNDLAPTFTFKRHLGQVRENLPSGSDIARILPLPPTTNFPFSVTDGDGTSPNNQFTLFLTGTNSSHFAVSGLTVVTNTRLDREVQRNYQLRIHAIDQGSPQLNSSEPLLITVNDDNDNTPIFQDESYGASIREDYNLVDVILTVSATDIDDTATTGNGDVQYFQNETQFTLNTTSGVLVLRSSLDRETQDSYLFFVYALDSPKTDAQRTASVLVNVTVLDVDDNLPTTSLPASELSVTFVEGSTVGVSVATNLAMGDRDIIAQYPITAARAQLRTATGGQFPEEGGLCRQELLGGAGAAVKLPYTDPLDMCRWSGAVNILPESSLCGSSNTSMSGLTIVTFSNATTTPSSSVTTSLSSTGFVLSFWFRATTAGVLYCRYHNFTSLSITVNISTRGITIDFEFDLILFTGSSVLDNQWHHLLLRVESLTEVTVYLNGLPWTPVYNTTIPGGTTALLAEPVRDGSDIRTFIGGSSTCQGGASGTMVSQVLLLNDALNATDLACCIASCGESVAVTANLQLSISRQYHCSSRTLQLTASAALPNSDSLSAFQELLQSLTYFNSLDEPHLSNRTLALSARDTVGYGAELIVSVENSLVNDKRPELYVGANLALNNSVTFTEDSIVGVTLAHADTSLLDPDSGIWSISEVTVRLVNGEARAGANEGLSFDLADIPNSITVTNDATARWIRFTPALGSAQPRPTHADFVTAVRSVQYFNRMDEPLFYRRVVEFTVSDGVLTNNPPAYVHVDIEAVNDIPLLDFAPGLPGVDSQIDFRENSAPVQLAPDNATLDDSDNTTMVRAVATLISSDTNDQLVLGSSSLLPITTTGFVRSPSGGTITFLGEDSVANYLTALKSVSYANNADNPPSTSRAVEFYVFDGISASPTVTVTITLEAVNDLPQIDLNGPAVAGFSYATTFVEEGACVALAASDADITDVDTSTLELLSVVLTNRLDGTQESIQVTAGGLLVQQQSLATVQQVNISGTASLATYNAVLRSLLYCNTRDEPSTADRSVSFYTVDSNQEAGVIQTTTVSITPINDAPVLSAQGQPSFIDNSPGPQVFSSITITDEDDTTLDSFTVAIQMLYDGSSEVLISDLAAGNSSIRSTYTTANDTGVLTISFSDLGGLPIRNVQDVLLGIRYDNTADEPSTQTRTICANVEDSSLVSNTVCVQMNVTLVNDHAPIITSLSPSFDVINETTQADFVSTVAATDGDAGSDGVLVFSITSVWSRFASNGTVEQTGTNLFSLTTGTGGLSADISTRQALDAEVYDYHTLTVRVQDMGQPSQFDEATLNVTVVDLNDHTPRFAQASFAVTIPEYLGLNEEVIRIPATDADATSPNNVISRYVLTSGFTNALGQTSFSIDSQGTISLTAHLDIDREMSFTIIAEAEDGGSPARTATATVAVTVQAFSPCYANLTTNTYLENRRSQVISPPLTIGCRTRIANITQTVITLSKQACPASLRLCQSTTKMVACEFDKSHPMYDIMDLAQNSFVTTTNPTDASCTSTAKTFIRVSNQQGSYGILANTSFPDLSQGSFTVSYRGRLTLGVKGYIFSVNHEAAMRYFSIYIDGADMVIYYMLPSATRFTSVRFNTANINDNAYHHLVLAVVGPNTTSITFNLYKDCDLFGTVTGTGPMVWQATDMQIGRRVRTTGDTRGVFYLDGIIDSLLIQQRLWTDEDRFCMCSDGLNENCGELFRTPQVSQPTVALGDYGRRLTFSGTHSVDVYETAMRLARYLYIPTTTVDFQRTLTYTITDSRGNSGQNTTEITVTDTNSNVPPEVNLAPPSQNTLVVYTEGTGGQLTLANQLTVTDRDGGFLSQAVVTLVSPQAGANERLGFSTAQASASQITGTFNGQTQITFTAATSTSRTLADFINVLRTVTYEIGTPGVFTGIPSQSISFVVTDTGSGGVSSIPSTPSIATVRVRVITNPNGPSVSGLQDVSHTIGPNSTFIAGSAVVNDPDSTQIVTQLTATIVTSPTTTSPITGLLCENKVTLLSRSGTCMGAGVDNLIPEGPSSSSHIVYDDTNSAQDGREVIFNGQRHISINTSTVNYTNFNVSAMTVSIWFKQAAGNNGYAVAFHTQAGVRYFDIYLRSQDSLIEVHFAGSSTALSFPLLAPVADGAWHHVVATTQETGVTLYIDGVSRGEFDLRNLFSFLTWKISFQGGTYEFQSN